MKKTLQTRNQLQLAGRVIERGNEYDLSLDYSESFAGLKISIPVHVIAAREPGPCLFLTALVHGDELNGLGIIHELLFENRINLVRGTLVAIPVVNIHGLEMFSRYLPDRRDLNRCFPGTSKGSLSGRLAHLVYSEIIRYCDYGIDFHTAAVRRTNYPNIRADLSKPDVLKMARAFGCELIVNTKGALGSLRRVAVNRGIPTIVLEAGEVWKIEPGVVEVGVRGALNVMKHLGMIEGNPLPPAYESLIYRTRWIRAEHGGILRFHANPGDVVLMGQDLASNMSLFGREKSRLTATADGIILGMTTMPAVKPGEPLFHLALPDQPIETIIKEISALKDSSLSLRLRQDLATNVHARKPSQSKKKSANKKKPRE